MLIHDRIEGNYGYQIDHEWNENPIDVFCSKTLPLSIDYCLDVFKLENG